MTAVSTETANIPDDSHRVSQSHLAKQDAATVDPSKLTALTPEVVCIFLFR